MSVFWFEADSLLPFGQGCSVLPLAVERRTKGHVGLEEIRFQVESLPGFVLRLGMPAQHRKESTEVRTHGSMVRPQRHGNLLVAERLLPSRRLQVVQAHGQLLVNPEIVGVPPLSLPQDEDRMGTPVNVLAE